VICSKKTQKMCPNNLHVIPAGRLEKKATA
jgi:hypothetical protein